jgi:hypothetical protein
MATPEGEEIVVHLVIDDPDDSDGFDAEAVRRAVAEESLVRRPGAAWSSGQTGRSTPRRRTG